MSRDTTEAVQPLRADGSCFSASYASLRPPWILTQPRAPSRLDCLLHGRKRPRAAPLCTHFFEPQPPVALSPKLLEPVHCQAAGAGPAPSTAAHSGPATAPCAPPYAAPHSPTSHSPTSAAPASPRDASPHHRRGAPSAPPRQAPPGPARPRPARPRHPAALPWPVRRRWEARALPAARSFPPAAGRRSFRFLRAGSAPPRCGSVPTPPTSRAGRTRRRSP